MATYQVLARKWRPQAFDDLIGQEPIVTALRNALGEGRIAQAYVFSGIRGVGKTTAARLLAKCLNCEQGPTPRPCNACVACREITAGADLDVLEVDAATHSKVEQVRELTDSLRYGPARDRYKVVVLDEVHRLSRQAFDALLKIVEEPPPRVVFVFATTEIDAVPATILSRCQEYAFRRVPAAVVQAHLRSICDTEGIRASDGALRLIARAGEGSVRDSVALLDQLSTFGAGAVDETAAAQLVGGLDQALFAGLLAAILEGRPADVVAAARAVEAQGLDPRQTFSHFLSYCRGALHLAVGADPGSLDLPGEEIERLARSARSGGYENLLRLLHHLLASEPLVRRSDAGVLAAEIAWLRAAELPKLVRVEELLAQGGLPREPGARTTGDAAAAAAPRTPGGPAPRPAKSSAPATVEIAAPTQAPAPSGDAATGPAPLAAAAHAPSGEDATPLAASGAAEVPGFGPLVEAVSRRRPALAARLRQVRSARWVDSALVLRAEKEALEALARPAARALLDEAMEECHPGRPWRLEEASGDDRPAGAAVPVVAAPRGESAAPAPPGPTPQEASATAPPLAGDSARQAIERHPRVQAVLEIFGGSVTEILAPPLGTASASGDS